MQANDSRAPLSARVPVPVRSARGAARVPDPPPPALILYGVAPDVAAECELIARELRLARAEVKHLQAACIALKTHPRAMMLASATIRSWDREVVEEHAARAAVPLRWVTTEHAPNDVGADVRKWAVETLRRARTLR